jgi:mannitol-1-/sugar-/sorbitol-6-phosphatase
MSHRLFSISTPTWSVEVVGVLVDVDGTLVDSTPAIERQWRTFLDWYGLPASAFPNPLHGKRAEDHIRDLLPAAEVEAALERFMALEVEDLAGIIAVPGAAGFVDALTAANCPWALVTSGTLPVATARLAMAGLPLADVIVTAEDVARGKPDPQPYLVGMRRLGLPGPTLAIEDAPTGIASAKAAGCQVVAVSTTHAADELTHADHVLPDLLGLRVVLQQNS